MSTAAASPKPRSRNREATERALVEAASRVFAERGYENATTKSVAEAAGCSEGLIQRYFNGKEGLLLATLREKAPDPCHADFYERPLCASIAEEARETMEFAAAHMARNAEVLRIVLSRALVDPAFRANFQRLAVRPQIKQQLLARFERCVEAGLVDPAVDLEAAVDMLMSLNFQLGFLQPHLKVAPPAAVRRMVAAQSELFARAVAPAPRPAPRRATAPSRKKT